MPPIKLFSLEKYIYKFIILSIKKGNTLIKKVSPYLHKVGNDWICKESHNEEYKFLAHQEKFHLTSYSTLRNR